MAKKQTEYDRGRWDMLSLCLKLGREGGIEAIEEQAKLRGVIGDVYPITKEQAKKISEGMKATLETSLRVVIMTVLHNDFGFGEKRIQRFMRQYDKFIHYLDHGWVAWIDVVEELKKDLKLEIGYDENSEWFTDRLSYTSPEAEDIFTPDDFICPADWSQLLQDLGYTDWQDKTIPSKHYIRSGDGSLKLFEYDGQADQVRMYEFLNGIRYAVQTWGLADEKEG